MIRLTFFALLPFRESGECVQYAKKIKRKIGKSTTKPEDFVYDGRFF